MPSGNGVVRVAGTLEVHRYRGRPVEVNSADINRMRQPGGSREVILPIALGLCAAMREEDRTLAPAVRLGQVFTSRNAFDRIETGQPGEKRGRDTGKRLLPFKPHFSSMSDLGEVWVARYNTVDVEREMVLVKRGRYNIVKRLLDDAIPGQFFIGQGDVIWVGSYLAATKAVRAINMSGLGLRMIEDPGDVVARSNIDFNAVLKDEGARLGLETLTLWRGGNGPYDRAGVATGRMFGFSTNGMGALFLWREKREGDEAKTLERFAKLSRR